MKDDMEEYSRRNLGGMKLGELFGRYYSIFEVFGVNILNNPDETLGHIVFRETADSMGLCANIYLKCLLNEGLVSDDIMERSALLYKAFWDLRMTGIWDEDFLTNSSEWKEVIKFVRTSPRWLAVMELADEIKTLIDARWTEDELQAIKGIEIYCRLE